MRLLKKRSSGGLFQSTFTSIFSTPWLAIVLQAALFGHAHFQGIPSGWGGVALAGSYGLVLGIIRERSGGLGAPIVAHIFADLAIFTMLYRLAA